MSSLTCEELSELGVCFFRVRDIGIKITIK
jgi:hypothetical protein